MDRNEFAAGLVNQSLLYNGSVVALDDPLDVRLRQFAEDSRQDLVSEIGAAGLTAVLSLFPVGGAAINRLLSGKARRNLQRRVVELFEEMRRRLEEIKESVPDENYFCSEEFQTLLALALLQLQTTHDENKRKMLASALANSGAAEFCADESKEQYIRTLRDLSPQDLLVLNACGRFGPAAVQYYVLEGTHPNLQQGRTRSSLTRLIGLGLVSEELVAPQLPPVAPSSNTEAARVFLETIQKPPERKYIGRSAEAVAIFCSRLLILEPC